MSDVRRPWFALYVDHFEADERVRLLSNQAVGCYIKLLCVQWREGSIPSDLAKLARLVNAEPDAFKAIWRSGLAECFRPTRGLRMVNPRLEEERRRAAEIADRLREAGRRGGKTPRSRKPGLSQASEPEGTTVVRPGRNGGKAAALEAFAGAWAEYPKRAGSNPRKDAEGAFLARLAEGVPVAELLNGLGRYKRFCQATGKVGSEYVMQARRFFGRARPFDEPWDLPPGGPQDTPAPKKPAGPTPFKTA